MKGRKPSPNFLFQKPSFLVSAAQEIRVFLSPSHKIGKNLFYGTVGKVFVNIVTIFSKGVGNVIAHSKELAKENTASFGFSISVRGTRVMGR